MDVLAWLHGVDEDLCFSPCITGLVSVVGPWFVDGPDMETPWDYALPLESVLDIDGDLTVMDAEQARKEALYDLAFRRHANERDEAKAGLRR